MQISATVTRSREMLALARSVLFDDDSLIYGTFLISPTKGFYVFVYYIFFIASESGLKADG